METDDAGVTAKLDAQRTAQEEQRRVRFRLGGVDQTLDARACPGGCTLVPGLGTCDRRHNRFCLGYAAWVCAEAYAAWDQGGRRELSAEALAARDGGRPDAPLPLFVPPPSVQLIPVLRTAPAELDAWEAYAPHLMNGRGTFWDDEQRRLRGVFAGWDRDWPRASAAMPWMVLLGPPGTGKTFLLRIAARRAALAGVSVEWVVWPDLVERINASYSSEDRESEDAICRPLERAGLLVLDDVRMVHASQHDENIAHRLLSRRYGEDRGEDQRLVLMTANLSVSELELVIGAAALSRLRAVGRIWVCDWPAHQNRQPLP